MARTTPGAYLEVLIQLLTKSTHLWGASALAFLKAALRQRQLFASAVRLAFGGDPPVYLSLGNNAGQFTTTVSDDGPPRPIGSCTIKRRPSGVTSYRLEYG